MHCAQKMTHNIYWIGSNDWTTERFENLFPIPNGVSYNSYFIDDEKTCVVDSVDAEIREEYFDNLTHLLNGRDLIHHRKSYGTRPLPNIIGNIGTLSKL